MLEAQLGRVEELPPHAVRQLVHPAPCRSAEPTLPAGTIDRVTYDRMPDMGEMHTDLVRPTGFEGHVEQVGPHPAFLDLHSAHRAATVFDDGHTLPVLGIPPDGRLDGEVGFGEVAPRRCRIQSFDAACPKRVGQHAVCRIGLGHHQKARCALVDPVNDAPVGVVTTRRPLIAPWKTLNKRLGK